MITDIDFKKILDDLQSNNVLEFTLRKKLTPEQAISFFDEVAKNKSLKTLNLANINFKEFNTDPVVVGNNSINTYGAKLLANALQINKSIRVLILEKCELYPTDIKVLAGALKVNKTLEHLNLSKNHINDLALVFLSLALEVNSSIDLKKDPSWRKIRRLDLMNSYKAPDESPIGMQQLAVVLKNKNCALKELHFNANTMSTSSMKQLALGLKGNKSLQLLNLGSCKLEVTCIKFLGEALAVNQTLQVLYLNHNNLGPDSAQCLANSLMVNKTLQHLNLANNQIANQGAEYLAKAMNVNKSLRELDLTYNEIGSLGVGLLLRVLETNRTLRQLVLYGVDLTSRSFSESSSANYLSSFLINNKFLQELNLQSSGIGNEELVLLKNALIDNHSLLHLNLNSNKLTGDSIKCLAEILRVNHTLQILKLENNYMNLSDIQLLSSVLKINRTLQQLYLKNNGLNDRCADLLLECVDSNYTLEVLEAFPEDNPLQIQLQSWMIRNINYQNQQKKLVFLMGLHETGGQGSILHNLAFCKDTLFDRNLIPLLFSFFNDKKPAQLDHLERLALLEQQEKSDQLDALAQKTRETLGQIKLLPKRNPPEPKPKPQPLLEGLSKPKPQKPLFIPPLYEREDEGVNASTSPKTTHLETKLVKESDIVNATMLHQFHIQPSRLNSSTSFVTTPLNLQFQPLQRLRLDNAMSEVEQITPPKPILASNPSIQIQGKDLNKPMHKPQ